MSGSTTARGYGAEHQAQRRAWQRVIDAQGARCHARVCLAPTRDIARGTTRWDLGHTVDRTGWTGPEHPKCNRADGGRRSGRHRSARPLRTSRRW